MLWYSDLLINNLVLEASRPHPSLYNWKHSKLKGSPDKETSENSFKEAGFLESQLWKLLKWGLLLRNTLLVSWPRHKRAAKALQIKLEKKRKKKNATEAAQRWFIHCIDSCGRVSQGPLPLLPLQKKAAANLYSFSSATRRFNYPDPITQTLHNPWQSRNCPRTTSQQERNYPLEDAAPSSLLLK